MKYSQPPTNLTNELRRASKSRTAYWDQYLYLIGTDKETAVRKRIGVLPVHTSGNYFQPLHPKDGFGKRLFIIPTGFRDGQYVIDMIATDGKSVWRRLGTDHLLGEGDPVHASVGGWLRAGGKGSCWIGKAAA